VLLGLAAPAITWSMVSSATKCPLKAGEDEASAAGCSGISTIRRGEQRGEIAIQVDDDVDAPIISLV